MLQALGVENYGINSVVGGIVGMSSIITGTMSAAISRYLTYGLGRGDKNHLRITFSTAVTTQIIMSVIAVLALETIGLWFLNYKAQIPDGRMSAANWVFQCSIVTLVVALVSSPYNALIVAHERMGIYAYTSIVEAILKLLICFVIRAYDGDRLILLAILHVFVGIGMRIFYGWYCGRHFEEAHYRISVFDKGLLKELATFSGWNLFGKTTWVLNTQGVSMLVNVFFGVIYNAAQGVANTVNNCIEQFVNNFTMAFSPQITKTYAGQDYEQCYRLVNRGCRFTWMLMLVFIVPVFIESEQLLSLWLVEVPEMASLFLRYALFNSLALMFSQPLFKLIQAQGNIKRYTIEASLWGGAIFPVTWLLYLTGAPVWSTYPIAIFVRFSITALRLISLNRLTTFKWRSFIKETMKPCLQTFVLAFLPPYVISCFWQECVARFFVLVPLSTLWVGAVCYKLGLEPNERKMIILQVKKMLHRR